MKRWIAGMVAVLMLWTCSPVTGQESLIDADIQESLQTREGEGLGSLADNLKLIIELIKDEDVQNLLQIQDVKDLMSEGVTNVLIWMIENRPVTMKILKEFGINERDRNCIGKIWDSAERISEALNSWMESEEGRQFQADMNALGNDPEFSESLDNFFDMITSDNVSFLLETIITFMAEGGEQAQEIQLDSLTAQDLEEQLDRTTFTGMLLMKLLQALSQSKWAQDSLPALLKNNALKRVLITMAKPGEMDAAIRQEGVMLGQDPEIRDFLRQTTMEIYNLFQITRNNPDQPAPNEENNKISEEDIP